LTYPEGAITKTVITSSKIYDGYGRVLTATENGTATTFSYDQLNRMTTQTCGEETTAFTYGDRLTTLSELSRIQASYSRNGGAAVTMMDASREFDNFGRIVTQRDPNYDASGMRKVVKRIRYRSPTEQTPYFVETDRGSTWFEHNSITGQLTYFDVTGDAKDKTLEHTAAYDPVSKLISNVSTREIDPNSGLDRNTVSHNYGYDSFGAATSISTMFGVHAVGATTRNSFSRFSTILESMELLDHRNVLICKESSLYDSIGRLTRKEFITGSGLNFFATVTYSTVARGNSSSGKPTEIHITDSNTLQDILRIYFSYDKFGNESDRRTRVMVDGAEHEALTFNQVTMDDGNAKSRTIAYQPPFSPRSSVTTNYEYTPSKKYLLRSTTNEGWRTYSTLYEDTVFSAASGIFTEMPSAALTVDFLRRGDQLGSMDSNADTHEVRDFTYDDNGNVASITISDVNTKQNTYKVMTYNAMNQLLKVSKNGSDIAGYSYDFFGKLVKISDIAKNRTRCLLYGADGLIGEIGGIGDEIARTVYINVGGISIGRYVYKSTNQSPVLELFATTPDGTVHAVYKYVDGRVNRNNAVNFSYSDEGIRKHDVTGDQLDYPIGFKGYFIDSATGCYILGDGFRVYDPIMRQFWSADSISPFGGGGPNRYHYCDMDPINRSDHSGNDWGWEQRLNRPWWKRWGWVIAEALIGAAVGAVTGFLVGGPAGAIAGAIAGGVAAGLGASLKAAAEEVILADSASRTDPTRGDYYIPPAATHLDNFGYGVDLASMFGGSLAGSAAAKPSLASKVGQGSASSAISAGSRAGSMGSKASGLSSAASGGKHAVSGPSRSFPGILAKGSNIRSSLQKNAATGGFKAYPVTFNGQPHTIHLSKVRTNNLRVRRQMMSSYTNGPNKTMHTLSGAHGDLKGHVSAADASFLLEDIDSARIMRRLAARNGAPAPQITHTDIGQGSWQTNKIWAQAQLEQAPGKADEVIYAFCHSGLNSELRAQLGLKRVWAPWRWWGAT